MSEPRAHLVVDLGFGDAGKGTVTDALVRAHGAALVIRANGGAQAGHNVVLDDGTHHTFSQLGAGSFVAGARTLLASSVVVHPLALAVEARVFAAKTARDPLPGVFIDDAALVTTPYHQAMGRLRELARGMARHGSCGVGVGETVAHAIAHADDALSVGTLARDRGGASLRLRAIRERLRAELAALRPALDSLPEAALELSVFDDATLSERFVDAASSVLARAEVVDRARLATIVGAARVVVCEGAQGVLLDEWHGMHPFTTYSTCTFEPQQAALARYGFSGRATRYGVLRSYMVRHGLGPLPTGTDALDGLAEPHNEHGPWQGRFRRGWLDLPLLRYAIACCGGVDALALTHLDALERVDAWQVGTEHRFVDPSYATFAHVVSHARDLDVASRRTRALASATPRLEAISFGDDRVAGYVDRIEHELAAEVALVSSGPKPRDKRFVRAV